MSATVHQLARVPRQLAYRYFRDDRLGDLAGIQRTMAAIERQISLAHDYGEQQLVEVLLAMNPDLDESVAADLDRLFDLSAVAAGPHASQGEATVAEDEYLEHLRDLARTVRGAR